MTSPAFTQVTFRIRNDNGNETTATWRQNQGVDDTLQVDTNYRIRFRIDETASRAWTNKVWNLYVSKNGGAYAAVGSGQAVKLALSGNFTQGADCTTQLTGGTGTFVTDNNGMCESAGATNSGSAGYLFEVEYCFQIDSAYVANGDTLNLRVYDGTSAIASYTDTPVITVAEPVNLSIEDSFHSNKSDDTVLTLTNLTIEDSYHRLTSDEGLVPGPVTLEIGECFHVFRGRPVGKSSGVKWPTDYITRYPTWIGVTNIYADDTNFATASATVGNNAIVKVHSFDLSGIPSTAEITRITVTVYYAIADSYGSMLAYLVKGADDASLGMAETGPGDFITSIPIYTKATTAEILTTGDDGLGVVCNLYADISDSSGTVQAISIEVWYYDAPTGETLVIEDSYHSNKSEDFAVTTQIPLTIEKSFHTHKSEDFSVSTQITLVIEESFHSHTAEDAPVTKSTALVIEKSFHGHVVEEPLLTKSDTLVVEESRHSQTAEDFVLGQLHNLAIEEARHGHLADDFALTQLHNLVIAEAVHAHQAEDVLITRSDTLVVGDSFHSQTAEDLVLSTQNVLSVGKSFHTHVAEDVLITKSDTLVIEESLHSHVAENCDAAQVISSVDLVIQESFHRHVGRSCWFTRGIIFSAGHNAGDLSEYDSESDVDNLLSIDAEAALASSIHGMKIITGSTPGPAYAVKQIPSNESRNYRLRFYVDPNGLVGNNDHIIFLKGTNSLDQNLFYCSVRLFVGQLKVSVAAYDSPLSANSGMASISDSPNYVEVFFERGIAHLYVNGSYVFDVGTPNYHFGDLTNIYVGSTSLSGLDYYDPGSIYIDELVINDTGSYIGPADIIIEESNHGHQSDDISLGVEANLIIEDSAHTHQAEDISITTPSVLVIEDSFHAHTSEPLAIGGTLTVEKSFHAHTSDELQTSKSDTLAIEDSAHAHAAESAEVTVTFNLVIEDSFHTHQVESLSLTQVQLLSIEDSWHSNISEPLALTIQFNLSIEDSLHLHSSESVSITKSDTLVFSDNFHSHRSEDISITTVFNLSIEDSTHTHSADLIPISKSDTLSIEDALHAHSAGSPQLFITSTLDIEDSAHAHTSDEVDLSVNFNLSVGESFHSHVVPTIDWSDLTIGECFHAHTVYWAGITESPTLIIGTNVHSHVADWLGIWLDTLTIQDSRHGHIADQISLSGVHVLQIEDSFHVHTADLMDPDNLNIHHSIHYQHAEPCAIITGVMVALSLGDRVVSFTLSDRDTELEPPERALELGLEERDLELELSERVREVILETLEE